MRMIYGQCFEPTPTLPNYLIFDQFYFISQSNVQTDSNFT